MLNAEPTVVQLRKFPSTIFYPHRPTQEQAEGSEYAPNDYLRFYFEMTTFVAVEIKLPEVN